MRILLDKLMMLLIDIVSVFKVTSKLINRAIEKLLHWVIRLHHEVLQLAAHWIWLALHSRNSNYISSLAFHWFNHFISSSRLDLFMAKICKRLLVRLGCSSPSPKCLLDSPYLSNFWFVLCIFLKLSTLGLCYRASRKGLVILGVYYSMMFLKITHLTIL